MSTIELQKGFPCAVKELVIDKRNIPILAITKKL